MAKLEHLIIGDHGDPVIENSDRFTISDQLQQISF